MAYQNYRTSPGHDDHRDYDRDRERDGYEPYQPRDRSSGVDLRNRNHHHHHHHQSHRASGARLRSRSRSPDGPRGVPRGPKIHRSESRGQSTGSYYDRDAPQDRSRSRTPPERFVSRDVIIEGFGGEVQDDDIMRELVEGLRLTGIERVTLIRDRKTGASRGFAFIHFTSTADSAVFVDTFGPSVRIGDDKCRVAFSKERDEGDRRGARRRDEDGEDWRCRVCLLLNYPRRHECFRCTTPRSEVTLTGTLTHPTPTYFTNDGRRDMATSPPSQFLLFRNLEAGVNEEILSKGVLKLAVPASAAGASQSSVKRVLLVRDRRTDESWRFGFAEFSTPQEAQKAFKSYETMEKFTISSRPVTVSYIHPGVFVPVHNAPAEAEKFTFLPLMPVGGGMRLAYWDEEGYVSEMVLNKADENLATESQEKSVASKGTEKKGKKRKAEGAPSSAAEKLAAKKAALPAHLQFWQNRHSELRGGKPKPVTQLGTGAEGDVGEGNSSTPVAKPTARSSDESSGLQESFADMTKLACLLCLREFKTAETLHQHERVSTLHANNLKNPTLCEKARKKLSKNQSSSSEYRDRAKERREAFGPSTAPSNTGQRKKQKPKTPPAEEAEEPKLNKGASLLGKMGWSHGQGLGASGEGRTEHVVAEMYTSGVGLGMKGSKVGDVEEAVKGSAGGYQEFVRKTKERAKERYEEME